MQAVDLYKYQEFVRGVTSAESNFFTDFMDRLHDLDPDTDVNLPLLMTAVFGFAGEVGEFSDIAKKVFFQGKPLSEENIAKMKSELGDLMWYWINACRALNLDPNEVIAENVKKLEARYPGGKFSVELSEARYKEQG